VGFHTPFYSPKSHSKNAWWVSTSLLNDGNDTLKNAWWVSTSLLNDGNDSLKNAWLVSTFLFIRQKVILKKVGGYLPAFLFEQKSF
jgi:hypothetical protein